MVGSKNSTFCSWVFDGEPSLAVSHLYSCCKDTNFFLFRYYFSTSFCVGLWGGDYQYVILFLFY